MATVRRALRQLEEHDEEFPWSTFASYLLHDCLFRCGDGFFMRPGFTTASVHSSGKSTIVRGIRRCCDFVKSLNLPKRIGERPHCLKACDARITMTSLFLAGLAAESRRRLMTVR